MQAVPEASSAGQGGPPGAPWEQLTLDEVIRVCVRCGERLSERTDPYGFRVCPACICELRRLSNAKDRRGDGTAR